MIIENSPSDKSSEDIMQYQVYCMTKQWMKMTFDFYHRDLVCALAGPGIVQASDNPPARDVPDSELYRTIFHFRKRPPHQVREHMERLGMLWLEYSGHEGLPFPCNPFMAVLNTRHVGYFFSKYWIPLFLNIPGHESHNLMYGPHVIPDYPDMVM